MTNIFRVQRASGTCSMPWALRRRPKGSAFAEGVQPAAKRPTKLSSLRWRRHGKASERKSKGLVGYALYFGDSKHIPYEIA